MVRKVSEPVRIPATGNKSILEFVGRVSGRMSSVSIARMTAPPCWSEPAQQPLFDEVTIVISGVVRVEHQGGICDVEAGEAVVVTKGERIRYSNPGTAAAEYWAVCVPAFSPESAGRDA